MITALIPPVPLLPEVEHQGIHLLLSHLFDAGDYVEFYRDKPEDYIILDNGAHETGAGEAPLELFEKATYVGADEVVIPDVLFDRRGTVERAKRTLKWLSGEGWKHYLDAGMPRLMFVPQGSDRTDWASCLRSFLTTWDYWAPTYRVPLQKPVIGISKDYDMWRGGLTALISDYVRPVIRERKWDVHCLGWPTNLWSLSLVARTHPWVRSTDSAKPFVYAKNGVLLEPGGTVPVYPRRDKEYFFEDFDQDARVIARRNVKVFCASATDELVNSPLPYEDEVDLRVA